MFASASATPWSQQNVVNPFYNPVPYTITLKDINTFLLLKRNQQVSNKIQQAALDLQAAIPAAGIHTTDEFAHTRDNFDNYSMNRKDRIRVFYHLVAKLEREKPLNTYWEQSQRLSEIIRAVENVAHFKAKFMPPESLDGEKGFVPDIKEMLLRDKFPWYYQVENGQLVDSEMGLPGSVQVMPSAFEYTFVNNEGAIQVRRLREQSPSEPEQENKPRYYAYKNPKPDIDDGFVIFNVNKNEKDALGRPNIDDKVYLDPYWDLSAEQRQALAQVNQPVQRTVSAIA